MKLPEKCENIGEIREAIDHIDKEIIETIRVENNGNNGFKYQLTDKGVEFLKDLNKTLAYIK